jgi:hypothetical protein
VSAFRAVGSPQSRGGRRGHAEKNHNWDGTGKNNELSERVIISMLANLHQAVCDATIAS